MEQRFDLILLDRTVQKESFVLHFVQRLRMRNVFLHITANAGFQKINNENTLNT